MVDKEEDWLRMIWARAGRRVEEEFRREGDGVKSRAAARA